MKYVPLAETVLSAQAGYWGKDPGFSDVDVPVIRNGDIKTEGIRWHSLPLRSLSRSEFEKSVIKAGDVLLTTSGDCGQVTMVRETPCRSTCITNFVRTLRFDPELVLPQYAYRYLESSGFRAAIAPYVRGTTLQNLSTRDAFANTKIPLPSLDEQHRIAAALDGADALRAGRRRASGLLDELRGSIFVDMFGGRDWERRPFEDQCLRVTVGVVVRPASYYVDQGVPALRTLNVKPSRIDQDDLVYFTAEANDGPLAKSRLRAGDLVIARTGNAGVTAVVPPDLADANAIDLIIASPDIDKVLPTYLDALLNSGIGKRMVGAEARGQIQQHFNVGSLKKAEIPVPPLALQREFAECIAAVHEQAILQQRAGVADDELFASLQARAFRGEL